MKCRESFKMPLFGSQRQILQAIEQRSKALGGFVSDEEIAKFTKIKLVDVRDWLTTLEDEGFISISRMREGLKVGLKDRGSLELKEYRSSKLSQGEESLLPLSGPN